MQILSFFGKNIASSSRLSPIITFEGTMASADGPKSKKEDANAELRRTHAKARLTKQKIARQLSCAPNTLRTRRGDDDAMEMPAENEKEEAQRLVNHLKQISPFHDRWQIIQTINEGTYGVVFSVQDVKTGTKGVIKVAKAGSSDSVINATANWEAFILQKVFKANTEASIVRLLDHGMLQSFEGVGLEFMVLELLELRMHEHLADYTGTERLLRICQVAIMTLKGIYDLHKEGLLHRDLKPENMGLLSRDQPVVVIFDLGMARMYTDGEGRVRPFRSSAPFRGTCEWASGHALKCREQTRYDDLIAWLYCIIELYVGDKDGPQNFPWSSRSRNSKEQTYFKSMFCPARVLLKKCPKAFYPINTYLMTAQRLTCPDYSFIADRIKDAMEDLVPGSSADLTSMCKPLPEQKTQKTSPAEPPLKGSEL